MGLPDNAVRESRERVRAAIKNSGLDFPNKAYVVNLSPADLPKHSTSYDLAIAIGVLAATDQAPLAKLEQALFIGELSLDGTVRHVKGVMPMVYAALQAGFKTVYVPSVDAQQAALIEGIQVIPVASLGQLVEHLYGLNPIAPVQLDKGALQTVPVSFEGLVDFCDIAGQEMAKRALEIAAAGSHNVLLTGSPGSGKTLLARSMPGILPAMTFTEALEVTRIYSVADLLPSDQPLMNIRPFRAPHHTVSQAGLVGGGSIPRPGETSLAHLGVLFLDEAAEFSQKSLEVLRQPIEDKLVTISRANGSVTFPANFLLVLAINPCPCGFANDPVKACTCTPTMISRYQSKLSGALLDRIDLYVNVPRVEHDKLLNAQRAETSRAIRERVELARERQRERFADRPGIFSNADMRPSDIQDFCVLSFEAKQLLDVATRRMQLSARAYHRVLKLSRTIADLGGIGVIETRHVAAAIQYRPKLD